MLASLHHPKNSKAASQADDIFGTRPCFSKLGPQGDASELGILQLIILP